jgi:N,N'-diacetyllegionaminate synthase
VVAAKRCFVIAEAGVNHNGSPDLALKLVDAAADAGADAVKFQTFRTERLVARGTPTADYQARNTGATDQQAMLRSLELAESAYPALADRCSARGIEFMSTPFDPESARMLAAQGVRRIKIGSGDLTSLSFLEEIAALGLPMILSTGMSTIEEVAEAVDTVAPACRGELAGRVTLLHCTSTYPAPVADANLRAMRTLRERFALPVGYSDHTEGISVALAAVALGASVLEKHLTLDRRLPGPDHRASLEPADFAEMVRQLRSVESALGSELKQPCESELAVREVVRRSVALRRSVAKGQIIGPEDLTLLRPGTGIAPRELRIVAGRRAARDLHAGNLVQWTDLLP